MTIASNIKRLRLQAGLTQEELAKELGVTRASVTQWETGFTTPRMDKLASITEYFSVNLSDVVEDSAPASSCSCVDIPYFGAIAAGTPIDIQSADGTMPCPETILRNHPKSFFLKVRGNSMNRIIPDGAIALIDPEQTEPTPRGIYAVCINGDAATLKRIRPLSNGIELVPDSTDPTCHSILFDYSKDCEQVTIAGRMVWYMAPFDWIV